MFRLRDRLGYAGRPYYLFQANDYEGLICNYFEAIRGIDSNAFRDNRVDLRSPAARAALRHLVGLVRERRVSPPSVVDFDENKSYEYMLRNDAVFVRGWPNFVENFRKFYPDTSKFSALLLLANAYVDLGTWHGFTPYVGAGIGGANVKWSELRNSIGGIVTTHPGATNWRFAVALMAGTSYCLTNNLSLDVGYRFTRIEGGKMFGYANFGGPGFDKGLNIHEGRAGLRYQFGGSNGCSEPEPVAYAPEPIEPAPVYK